MKIKINRCIIIFFSILFGLNNSVQATTCKDQSESLDKNRSIYTSEGPHTIANKLQTSFLNNNAKAKQKSTIATNSLNSIIGAPEGLLKKVDVKRSRGSQKSLFVKDERGQVYYLKKSLSHPELQTGAEVISSWIYRHFGYMAPETYIVEYNSQRFSASAILPEGKDTTLVNDMNNTRHMRQLRVLAAFLKDWDRLRMGPNNRVFNDGSIALFDFGGTLGSRSLGEVKPGVHFSDAIGSFGKPKVATNLFGDFVGKHPMIELFDSFTIEGLRPDHPWHQLSLEDVKPMLHYFRTLDTEKIRNIVEKAKYSDPRDKSQMIDSLLMRRDIFLDFLVEHLSQVTSKIQPESYWAELAPKIELDFNVNSNRNQQISTDIQSFISTIDIPKDHQILFRGQEKYTESILAPAARNYTAGQRNKKQIEDLIQYQLNIHHNSLFKQREEQRKYYHLGNNKTKSGTWWDRAKVLDFMAHKHSKSNGSDIIISTTRSLEVASRWIKQNRFSAEYRYVYILLVPSQKTIPISQSLISLHGSNKESEVGIFYNATPYIIGVYDTIDLKFIPLD